MLPFTSHRSDVNDDFRAGELLINTDQVHLANPWPAAGRQHQALVRQHGELRSVCQLQAQGHGALDGAGGAWVTFGYGAWIDHTSHLIMHMLSMSTLDAHIHTRGPFLMQVWPARGDAKRANESA